MASAFAKQIGNEERALSIASLQKELHLIKLQESFIANAIRQKEVRHFVGAEPWLEQSWFLCYVDSANYIQLLVRT